MEYENIDEATQYQEACRKVKQIADAIKSIRIKYYPNFAKITETDRQAYDELNAQLEKIANESGLDKLKAELINDIADKFDVQPQDKNGEQGEIDSNEKILKAYYGAIDAEKQALSEGKLKRALNCQKQANIYMEKLESISDFSDKNQWVKIAIDYKRRRFAELVPARQDKTTNWDNIMKGCYKVEDVQARNEITQEISGNVRVIEHTENSTDEMILE